MATFAPEFLEDHGADEEDEGEIERVKEGIRAAFKAKREVERVKFESVQKRLAAYTVEERAALETIKKTKYYPNHPIHKVGTFVNDVVSLALGKADVVVPPVDGFVFPAGEGEREGEREGEGQRVAPGTERRGRPVSRVGGEKKRARSVGRASTPKKLRR